MVKLLDLPFVLLSVIFFRVDGYQIGAGIADITGTSAEIVFLGYANTKQEGSGIQQRQRSRAFIFSEKGKRVVYVSNDLCMIFDGVKDAVIENLSGKYGKQYTHKNVLLHATHTHNGPGGYAFYPLYNIFGLGFDANTYDAIVSGITLAIERAHNSLQDGVITWSQGSITNASANRSPTSYLLNPEISNYKYNTDKMSTTLRFDTRNGEPIGVLHNFAVHGTSQNFSNTHITGDNKGLASYLFEQEINGVNVRPGSGGFISAFGQANCGDISPNLNGASCPDGTPCEPLTSTCDGKSETCIADGPGKDMQESCEIIANRTFKAAFEFWKSSTNRIDTLDLQYIHTYVDMENCEVNSTFTTTGKTESTCLGALGDSFAAGTTDGHGDFDFTQGANSSDVNPYWNFIASFLSDPTPEQIKCQAPKPILLNTGGITFPSPWTARQIPIQILKVGTIYLVALPGEFTTMAGRRIRDAITKELKNGGVSSPVVVLCGLSNTYTHYISTYEEYQAQRYEAASTLFGPHTLAAHTQNFVALAKALAAGIESSYPPGTRNPDYSNNTMSFKPGVIYDSAPFFTNYGDVETQPKTLYAVGEEAYAVFWGASPRNNVLLENSFCDVESLMADGSSWYTYRTDSDWDTKFTWERHEISESKCTCSWGRLQAGTYRFVHRGFHKSIIGTKTAYKGVSNAFDVK